MFIAVFCITPDLVRDLLKGMFELEAKNTIPEFKVKARNLKGRKSTQLSSSGDGDSLTQFLQDTPKTPSHYSRKRSQKIYCEPGTTSLAELHRRYSDYCKEISKTPMSISYLRDKMRQSNDSLFQPKTDSCEKCGSYDAGNWNEEYKEHRAKNKKPKTPKI